MWVLVWIQLISGMPLDYFELGQYDNRKTCEQQKEKAGVMITHNGITVACINLIDVGERQ
tara:strand:+ start:751 stop:930 length:180 start_codon:yes stop_codon:yes gene_type:complete